MASVSAKGAKVASFSAKADSAPRSPRAAPTSPHAAAVEKVGDQRAKLAAVARVPTRVSVSKHYTGERSQAIPDERRRPDPYKHRLLTELRLDVRKAEAFVNSLEMSPRTKSYHEANKLSLMEYKTMDDEFIRQAKDWYHVETHLKTLLKDCIKGYHSESRFLDGNTNLAMQIKTKASVSNAFHVWRKAHLATAMEKEAVRTFGDIVEHMIKIMNRKVILMMFVAWSIFAKLRALPRVPINQSLVYARGPDIRLDHHKRMMPPYLPVGRTGLIRRSEALALKQTKNWGEEEEAKMSSRRGIHYRCYMGGHKGPGPDQLAPDALRQIMRLWSWVAHYLLVEHQEVIWELQLKTMGFHVETPMLNNVTGQSLVVEMQEEFMQYYEQMQEEERQLEESGPDGIGSLGKQFSTNFTQQLPPPAKGDDSGSDVSESSKVEKFKLAEPNQKNTIVGNTQFKSKEEIAEAGQKAFMYNLPDHEDYGNALNYYFRGFQAWRELCGFTRCKHAAIREIFRERDERALMNAWRKWVVQCYKYNHNTNCIENIRDYVEGGFESVPYIDEDKMLAYLNWLRLFTLMTHKKKWVVDLENARSTLEIQRQKYERVMSRMENELRDVIGETDYFEELGKEGFDLAAKARFLALQT